MYRDPPRRAADSQAPRKGLQPELRGAAGWDPYEVWYTRIRAEQAQARVVMPRFAKLKAPVHPLIGVFVFPGARLAPRRLHHVLLWLSLTLRHPLRRLGHS